MTMKIHVYEYAMFSLDFSSKRLHMQDFGIELSLICHELSVQVFPCYTCSRIAQNNPIWIEHWNYEEIDCCS